MTTTEALTYVRRFHLVEDAPKRHQRNGWQYVVYVPGTAQLMSAADLRQFARNLRVFG